MSETMIMENVKADIVLKTREELIQNLFVVIAKKSSNEGLRDFMQEVYKDKKMVEIKVDSILKGQILLNTLGADELGVWCVYLNEYTLDKTIAPEKYYTEYVIERIKQYYDVNAKKTKTDRIILHNVVKVKNQYLCPFISHEDIALYMDNGLFGYDMATQRPPDIINVKGMLLQQPSINFTSVKEISDIIYEDLFTCNLITVNILKKSNFNQDKVFYDEKEKTLTILEPVFILDGFHRVLGSNDAYLKSKETGKVLEYGFMLSITNFTIREAQNHVSRESKVNPLDKEYMKTYDKNDNNVFIDAINNSGDSTTNEMKNKVANSLDEIGKDNKKYTTFNILNNALKIADLEFNIPSRNDDMLSKFILVFNTIIGEYLKKYDYTNIKLLKKECVTLMPNIFIGYVALAKGLLNRDDAKQVIKDMIRTGELDLSRKKDEWTDMEMFKKSPKTYKKIYDYFENILEAHNAEKGGE